MGQDFLKAVLHETEKDPKEQTNEKPQWKQRNKETKLQVNALKSDNYHQWFKFTFVVFGLSQIKSLQISK